LASITGSRAYCRFTGNQIAKIAKRTNPSAYGSTDRVALVSSFLSSLLIGSYAPFDASDASGMNLMDLWNKEWSDVLLQATAQGLREKLGGGGIVDSFTSLGTIAPYYIHRYGVAEGVVVICCTGDNPSSICGMRLSPQGPDGGGDVVVSLGTSDTLLGLTTDPHPSYDGHVMVSPRSSGEYMVMLCYKNGAVAREMVRDTYCQGHWTAFSQALERSSPGNNGYIGLYVVMEEITPQLNKTGIFRADASGKLVEAFATPEEEVSTRRGGGGEGGTGTDVIDF